MDDNVEQRHYRNLRIIHEIKDARHFHRIVDCRWLINELMKDVLTKQERSIDFHENLKQIHTGRKCSRVVAISIEDPRFFFDGNNGKPD